MTEAPGRSEEPAHHVEFDERSLRGQYRAAGVVAGLCGAVFPLFGRVRQIDVDKLPAAGPAIIVPAHSSYLDPILVGLMVWRHGLLPHYLAKDGLFTGLVGAALRRMGQIPVLRRTAHAGDSLRYAKDALDAGEVVVIYPQGTLTKDPEMWPQPAKSGAARLALLTGAPLIPVAHWGLHRAMPVRQKIPGPAPRARVEIMVGDPIDYSDLSADREGISALSARITAHIAKDVARLRGEELPERFHPDLGPEAAR